jgi:hypothetical protein
MCVKLKVLHLRLAEGGEHAMRVYLILCMHRANTIAPEAAYLGKQQIEASLLSQMWM